MATQNPQFAKASDKLDQDLARRAVEKIKVGEAPTVPEQRALKRLEKEREERLRWQHYATIPQKHWVQMSGRQAKVINEQALTYGIPFNGPVVNLPDVVRCIHDFFARNARRLRELDDDLMSGDSNSPALERFREERALLARFDRLERERSLVPRDEVRDGLGRIAARLKAVGEALERQYGHEALEMLMEAMDDVERDIERSFGDGADGQTEFQQPG